MGTQYEICKYVNISGVIFVFSEQRICQKASGAEQSHRIVEK